MNEYRFNEDEILKEIKDYVDKTYNQHYSQSKYQATEFIFDCGLGPGFCLGNILKYAQRYGHKGTPEEWRKDLLKICHYSIMAIYNHDNEEQLFVKGAIDRPTDRITGVVNGN